MISSLTKIGIRCSICMLLVTSAAAQTADTAEFKPKGQLWGYAFGDYAYKAATDDANRGGANQYTRIPVSTDMFQFRRIYLGYNYDISKKFSAELLLAAEDDIAAGVLGQGNGDVLLNNKFSPYIKLANIRWKNIWKGTDLVVGQVATPSFQLSESVWAYRSIERTVADIRRTPSFDFGAAIQGKIDKDGNYGYDIMVGNGQSARPENDAFKWFYGDVWAKFFKKRLIVQVYQDYQKLNWNPILTGQGEVATTTSTTTTYALPPAAGLHHDRHMTKLFVAWTDKKWTVGAEAFMNTIMGDVEQEVAAEHKVYYTTSKSIAVSVFARAKVYKEKISAFARYDAYDPSGNLKTTTDNPLVTRYVSLTGPYDPTTREQFITFGFDYTPIKNVHFMPNVWMNTYDCALPVGKYSLNSAATGMKGTDVVYRLTFYYVYGK